MIDLDTYVSSARVEMVPWTVEELLRVYGETLSLWEGFGWVPERVGGIRPSRPPFDDVFDESRRNPGPEDIEINGSIAIVKMAIDAVSDRDWAGIVGLANHKGCGTAKQLLGESQLNSSAEFTREANRSFLKNIDGQYAYILRQQRRYGYYQLAPAESAAHLGRNQDHRLNISHWSYEYPRSVNCLLLRDVFPNNYLNKKYLEAPVGLSGMSLREWIECQPLDRGRLTPFTRSLTEWIPPIEQIPQIREELYRAGRLFYWRFFLSFRRRFGENAILEDGSRNPNLNEPEPLYRPGILEPWEAPDPIPEIFTAEFYKDKDPSLIY